MKNLKEQRHNLKEQIEYLYSLDSFPGSSDWQEHRQAEQALKTFDLDHPEIIAKMIADQKAERTLRMSKLTPDQIMGM